MTATLLYDEQAVAAAELELRARHNAKLAPHTAYQSDAIGWAVDKLGVRRETLEWSLLYWRDGGADDAASARATNRSDSELVSKNAGKYPPPSVDRARDSNAPVCQWDGTPDPLAALFRAVADGFDVGVESGTGTGKSFAVAILILWFLACWENSQVFSFAPKEDQLRLYIWRNITELWPAFKQCFPSAEKTDLTIRMRGGTDESWAAHGFAVGIRAGEPISTRAAGMHAEHLLLVYEEMPGIDPAVIAAGEQTAVAPHNIRVGIGNPNHRLDTLHRFSTSAGVVHIRASALDHPNVVTGNASVVPGAVSRESIQRRLKQHGEDSPVYQSRVRGVSPEQAADALIRLEWLQAAARRYKLRNEQGKLPERVSGMGVDVANSTDGDKAAIVEFSGNVWTRCEAFPCPDANKLGAAVVARARTCHVAQERVGVDGIGVGAGTVNEARRLGFILRNLNAGSRPTVMAERAPDGRKIEWSADVNRFETLRAQMYWQAREDLRLGIVDGPEDQDLYEELTAPTFSDDGKVVKLEPKDDIKARLGRSPDKADAWVMANWVRERSVVAVIAQPVKSVSLGFDPKTGKPRDRVDAETEVAQMIKRARPNVTAGRFRLPPRR